MDTNKSSSPSSTSSNPPPTTITPSNRIADLNAIDLSISSLLHSASTATSILANQSSTTSLSAAQTQFSAAAESYFSTLSSIEVRLRRQVYALEEAGLIPAGDEKDARRGRTLNSEEGRVGGGLLDASWLNARASEGVERGMKRELLRRAKGNLDEDVNMEGNGAGNG